jgi:hypothetical protein
LQLADTKSTHSEECKKLAEMASVAVDYPKTGIKVRGISIPTTWRS